MLLYWIPLAALGLLVVYQQYRFYRIHRESQKNEELFKIVTENAADMIALVDMKGRRLYNSPAYKRILGYSSAELGETSSFEQVHPEDRMRVLEAAREARESGVGKRLEYRIKHRDGSWRVLESEASTIRDAGGEVSKLVIVNRDITERKRAEQQLEYNLFHDPLTGLPNRRRSSISCRLPLRGFGGMPDTPMPCCWPTSITSRFSTTPWARKPATTFLPRLRGGWARNCIRSNRPAAANPARWPLNLLCSGWGLTSLPFCLNQPAIPAMRYGWRSGFKRQWPSLFNSNHGS